MDAVTRRTLLLTLTVLEEHSRALRTLLLIEAASLDLEDTLGEFTRHERAIEAAARELQALRKRRPQDTGRRERYSAEPPRQGMLPLG
jgi:hypothetical protein